jgi:phospholipid transport system substrate-binding protein
MRKGYKGVVIRMTRRFFTGLVCMLLLSVFIAPASAEGPKEQVRDAIDGVLSTLKNKDLKKASRTRERRALIRKEVGVIFDFDEMSKRSLGRFWQQRTAAEKKEFVALFSDLLERSYIRKIESYTNEKILIDGQHIDGDYATVNTRLVTNRNKDIPIVYRMFRTGNKWMVYDVVIERVSFVGNYRTQFNDIIRAESYEGLVRRMKNKRIDDKLR